MPLGVSGTESGFRTRVNFSLELLLELEEELPLEFDELLLDPDELLLLDEPPLLEPEELPLAELLDDDGLPLEVEPDELPEEPDPDELFVELDDPLELEPLDELPLLDDPLLLGPEELALDDDGLPLEVETRRTAGRAGATWNLKRC